MKFVVKEGFRVHYEETVNFYYDLLKDYLKNDTFVSSHLAFDQGTLEDIMTGVGRNYDLEELSNMISFLRFKDLSSEKYYNAILKNNKIESIEQIDR